MTKHDFNYCLFVLCAQFLNVYQLLGTAEANILSKTVTCRPQPQAGKTVRNLRKSQTINWKRNLPQRQRLKQKRAKYPYEETKAHIIISLSFIVNLCRPCIAELEYLIIIFTKANLKRIPLHLIQGRITFESMLYFKNKKRKSCEISLVSLQS